MLDAGHTTQTNPDLRPRAYRHRPELEKDEFCKGEHTLWVRVLHRLVQDAFGKGCTAAEQSDAVSMIGDWPSRDFREICELAGFDPDYVHDALRRELSEHCKAKR